MMDWFVRYFLKGSLIWFSASIALAVAMALSPSLTVYRTAHMHMALLGFVTQMIYGVALHVIPRFFGQPLIHRRFAEAQFWLSQTGLSLLVLGFVARVQGGVRLASWSLGLGGTLAALGASCFILVLWRTMDASPMTKVNRAGRPVPLMPQPE